ncbi:MAG: bifunctional 4-hydroxy-2-oxoglutarate aldolase/2-dehydro-3-deoxy-phosphogluconate aldolase [Candidatus Omnitrophota bacterium]
MKIQDFKNLPILGILRGISTGEISPVVETCVLSGLKTIEITMNTDGAPTLIKKMIQEAAGRLTIGAGTVLSVEDAQKAKDAGAAFIVAPNLNPGVADFCKKQRLLFFPGALTPGEIFQAWEAGAAMVKVFPSGFFGPEYFKEIKGPFNQIELLACGGVNADNIGEFFRCGASAVAFGASVFKKEWLREKSFDKIGNEIQKLVKAYQNRA